MNKIKTSGRLSFGKSNIKKEVVEIKSNNLHKEEVIIACGGIQSIYSEIKEDGVRILLYHGPKRD